MLTQLYMLVNTKTPMLVVEHTYECTSGMTIPYLTYWTYAQMDVCLVLLNPMQYFKVMCMMCYTLMDTSTQKSFTHTQPSARQFLLII